MAGVMPVFVLNNQLPSFDEKSYTTSEICGAAEHCSGFESIEGAQRIGGLWRIYPHSVDARNKLLVRGFSLRGVQIEVKDKNPFLVTSTGGEEKEVPATKVIVNNVPLSFSDEEILKAVKKLGVCVRSKLVQERDRDRDGHLTRWKTGRRFLYIDIPKDPLPKTMEIGPFKAALYHKEQKKVQSDMECKKCLQKGHVSAQCPNPIKCRQCFSDGHTAGDAACSLSPDTVLDSGKEEDSSGDVEPTVPDTPSQQDKDNASVPFSAPVQERGRPAKRQKHNQGQPAKTGQTLLSFAKSSSRSASGKRPRSKDPEQPPPVALEERKDDEGPGRKDNVKETNDSPT